MAGVTLVAAGVFALWWLEHNFVTVAVFAVEKKQFTDQIRVGDLKQQLQLLYLRRDQIKRSIEEAVDALEKNPNSQKWRRRLIDRVEDKKTIERKIDKVNKELSN